ncbi:MAG: 3-oxoacyl-[acyl-carrier-protein] reductase, partial [Chitinispirillaceae bacterium]|nr:3-oxoacyl-[acyl-carrier-protein] reductase [Chitinispirillaceae bacterium]
MDLNSKTALVTGGGRGIGREIALRLAQAGCSVAVSDIDVTTAQSVAKELEALGVRALALQADVANSSDVATMFKSFVAAFGNLDVLVNNAGITRDCLLVRMKEEDWDLVLQVNLKSAYLCSKEAARIMMKARSGRIINIASVVGIIGNIGQANYTASKAGLIGLTKTVARELAARSITVNAIAPGFIKTAMTDTLPDAEKEKLAKNIPMQKLGTAADVANAVLFLASPLAEYIT